MTERTTKLATHGCVGRAVVPACPRCGASTRRLDGELRSCDDRACNVVGRVTFNDPRLWLAERWSIEAYHG